jgi:hypothetical protein
MVQYLKSPRVAKFSHESLLKQEEALLELDLSIDDWATKLDQAENRRIRVRQKLLEHVAAAITLSTASSTTVACTPNGEDTPPRSPDKLLSPEQQNRRDVESIRIYADSDVYALLADVEKEIGRMAEWNEMDNLTAGAS